MNSKIYFRKIARINRKLLLQHGFKASTLSEYANGNIFPSLSAAKKIAKITKTDIANFPVLKKTR
jgi:transcriptional regulator with XRE-family HTH domain